MGVTYSEARPGACDHGPVTDRTLWAIPLTWVLTVAGASTLTWTVIANESDKAWPLMRHLRSWREGLASSSAAPRRAD